MSEAKPRKAAGTGRTPLKVIKSEGQPVVVDLSATKAATAEEQAAIDKARADAEKALLLAQVAAYRQVRRSNTVAMRALRERIVARTMERMNRDHALIEYGNDVLVVSEFWDSQGEFKPRFRKRAAVKELLENRRVPLPKIGAKGKATVEVVNPVDIWMQDRRRRTLDELVNAPGQTVGPKKLNMWQGWGTKPRMVPLTDWDGVPALDEETGAVKMMPDYTGEKCPLILQHIREVWCANQDEAFEAWVLAWLADIVQHPTHKKGTGLMIYGGQGAGKSIIVEEVMRRILGSAFSMEKDTRFLTKDFNSRVGGRLLIFADEAIFAGDPQAAARLKTFLTAPKLDIRALYRDSVDVDNHARVFAAANPGPVRGFVLALDRDDRRWTVAEASEHRIGDTKYFERLMAEITNGGAEAFHAFLLNPQLLAKVNLRLPYQTASTAEQKVASLGDAEAFIYEALRSGEVQIGVPQTMGGSGDKLDRVAWKTGCETAVVKNQLHAGYLLWSKATNRRREPLLASPFAVVLRQMIPEIGDSRTGSEARSWKLPSLPEARAAFARFLHIDDEPGALAKLWSDETNKRLPCDPSPTISDELSRQADEEIPNWTEGTN